jgi:hypothetical protein
MAAYQAGAINRDEVKAVQLTMKMIAHSELMGDRMAILDPLPDRSTREVRDWRSEANYDSKYAALLLSMGRGCGSRRPPDTHTAVRPRRGRLVPERSTPRSA